MTDHKQLGARMGHDRLTRRLEQQSHSRMRLCGAYSVRASLHTIRALQHAIRFALKLTRLYSPGRRNALDLQVEHHTVRLPNLPAAFDGFRILHISDIHIDSSPELVDILHKKITALDFDACVFTGDYREEVAGHFETPIRLTGRLLDGVPAPAYGVLGNHDSIEMVPLLEEEGIRMLINESIELRRGDSSLYLAGVDDPYHYQTDHLDSALNDVPENGCVILLAHSPDLGSDAAKAGVGLYLCGHTHGGQICLPGGRTVIANTRGSADRHKGSWRHKAMTGYTSRGAGTSSVDVRFNCPPEITVHTLRCKTAMD